MLLQQIVGALDKELERLRALRSIVSDLEGTLLIEFEEAQPRKAVEAPAAPVAVEVKTVDRPITGTVKRERVTRSAGRPARESAKTRALREAREARALASSIPAGPVVVMPAALAKEIAARRETQRHEPEVKPERGSLGSMIRALHLDATA